MIYILISIYDFIFCIIFATADFFFFNCLKICFAIYLVFLKRGGMLHWWCRSLTKMYQIWCVHLYRRPGLQCISENSFWHMQQCFESVKKMQHVLSSLKTIRLEKSTKPKLIVFFMTYIPVKKKVKLMVYWCCLFNFSFILVSLIVAVVWSVIHCLTSS